MPKWALNATYRQMINLENKWTHVIKNGLPFGCTCSSICNFLQEYEWMKMYKYIVYMLYIQYVTCN